MVKKNTNTKAKSKKTADKTEAVQNAKSKAKSKVKIGAPSSIAELRTIAKSILALKNVPEKHEKAVQRLVDGCNKTADRIFNDLDSAEKKAEREAKKVACEKARAERDAKKTAKKMDKIKKLREQLAVLEAPAVDGK